MERSPADIETHLVDIQDMPLDELRSYDVAFLEPYLEAIREQVGRPRYNLGGAGPPGRVD